MTYFLLLLVCQLVRPVVCTNFCTSFRRLFSTLGKGSYINKIIFITLLLHRKRHSKGRTKERAKGLNIDICFKFAWARQYITLKKKVQ